jgi:hemolysin activation/secretion protein
MPATYESIATTTLGSAQADVTFTGISGSYTDLILITNSRASGASPRQLQIQVNSDTGSNYSATLLSGDGSTAGSSRASNATFMYIAANSASSGSFQHSISHFQNYSNTTTNKTVISKGHDSSVSVRLYVNLWRSTSAITSIKIYLAADNLDAGSTFTLYGIKAA